MCRRSIISDVKGRGVFGVVCAERENQGDGRFVRKDVYPKFTSDIPPNWKDIRTEFGYERVVRHSMATVQTLNIHQRTR